MGLSPRLGLLARRPPPGMERGEVEAVTDQEVACCVCSCLMMILTPLIPMSDMTLTQ